jgi:type VI secretion system protein ImpG
MDTRLLKHYEKELAFIREMGAEFAEAYPKIAARLGMDGVEINDPYVERMIESFAFLTGRIQLELEMQYPVFTQHLLEIIYPHYLAPTPAMTVVQFVPDRAQGNLEKGFLLPRGTVIRSPLRKGDQTACEFRSAHDVTLWPVSIQEAEYFDGRGEVVAAGMGANNSARAAIRLRIKSSGETPLADLAIDELTLFIAGADRQPWQLYEHLQNDGVGVVGRSADRRDDWLQAAGCDKLQPVGFSAEEALLPFPGQSFDGYRLLQEFFALPERFFFSKITGLRKIFQRVKGDEVDIYILLSQSVTTFSQALSADNFQLFCSPVVNLFDMRCDRVQVRQRDLDHHVVVDRTAPMDFEVYAITSVAGITSTSGEDIEFRAFYSSDDYTAAGESHEAYYAVRRRMRQRSEKQRLKGSRTSYLGSDVFLSLVDRQEAPYSHKVEQLAVRALCTNRDLALLLDTGKGKSDFLLRDGGPVKEVNAVTPVSRPRASLAINDSAAWRLVSHLSLNYLSIEDADRGSAAAALRELLGIYGPVGSRSMEKQLEGVVSVSTKPIVRRMSDEVLSTAVRGLEISITFDESAFEGSGVYLLGAVLERFFGKYVSLNSFTETVIHSLDRGEIARWTAMSGTRRMI